MATSSGGGGGPEAAAFAHFTNRDFDRAVEALQKVPQRLRGEARVQHNLAVAAFYRGGCVEIKRLVDALGALATAANAASAEASDGATGGSEGTGGAQLGLATLSYNQAVLFYHLRRYSASLEILEGGLYRNIEALDEDLALRVCLLLVEVYLVLGQGVKAAGVLLFVEKSFCSSAAAARSGASAGAGGDDSSANGSASLPSSTTPPRTSAPSASSSAAERPQPLLGPDQLQFVVHLYRARLQMLAKSANATKKELKQAGESLLLMQQQQQNVNAGTGGAAGQLAFLKAHLEYTRRNYRKSLKLLNASQKLFSTNNGDSTAASSTSSPSSPSSPDELSAPYYNNMGCIHYQLAKYSGAAFHLTKAIRGDWASAAEASTLARTSRRCEMYYNQGILLLVTGKPGMAFRCLLRAADTHHHQPRLWLRLAQCTIATYLAHERDAALRQQKSAAVARVTSHGGSKNRQVLLPVHPPSSSSSALLTAAAATVPSPLPAIPLPSLDASGTSDNAGTESQDSSTAGVQPSLTLRYGLECLRNALKLLEHNPEATAPAALASIGGTKPGTAASTDASAPAATAASGDAAASGNVPTAGSSTLLLECVCLLSMAYIGLSLEDPVVALAAASAVINGDARRSSATAQPPNGNTTGGGDAPAVTDEHRLLAHLYAAEALCMLNRPAEAMQHLSPSLVKDLPINMPSSSGSSGASSATPAPGALGPAPPTQFGLAPALASSARYVLYVNLAAAHILQDKLPQAQKCLLHASAIHATSPHALLLQAYIELARGNTAAALDLLQRNKIAPPSATTTGSASASTGGSQQQPQDGRGSGTGASFSAQASTTNSK